MADHGPIDELAGKTIARVIPGEDFYNNRDCQCALLFEFTDGTTYDVQSSYTHSVTYIERVHDIPAEGGGIAGAGYRGGACGRGWK